MRRHCPLRWQAWLLGLANNHLTTMKKLFLIAFTCFGLQACVVLAVADLAATTVVKTAGLVVDGTVGAVKMVGSAITPSSKEK